MQALDEFGHICAMVIHNSCVPFVAFFPDGRIMTCNPAFLRLTDYSDMELERMKMPDAIIPQEWTWLVAEVKSRLGCEGLPCPFECEIIKKGGSLVPVEIFAHEECDEEDNVIFYYAFINDISARKHAENELKKSEEKYRAVFDSANDSIVIQDVDSGKVVDINKASWEMYGYSREEYLGMDAGNLNCGKPPYTAENARIHIALAAAGEPQLFEWHARHKSGQLFWVEVNLKRISIGDTDRLLAVVRDITRRKHAEEEAQEARSQAELYLDLMYHDINNLNQIGLGYLELAMDVPGLDENVRELLSKPYDVLRNSSQLIDNVRKIRKIKEEIPSSKVVNILQVLESVKAQYAEVPGRDVAIHLTPAGGCFVLADDLVVDIFSNIVGNAIKHSMGPIAIDIKMSTSRMDGREWCKVIVEDNGPGIPDVMKEKIFKRIDQERQKPNGRGLGLYLVKLLVENYSGIVWAEDRVKGDHTQGCRFVVMLPSVKSG